MNRIKLILLVLVTLLIVSPCESATIHWFTDEPYTANPTNGLAVPLQTVSPNGYKYTFLSDLKAYVGASNHIIVETNWVMYSSNYYAGDTNIYQIFTNLFQTDVVYSNYFYTFAPVFQTNVTNLTVQDYSSYNSYVSNITYLTIQSNAYFADYFTTNIFPTTIEYHTNTIGGAFIANNGGEGTNTVLRGNTVITKAYGDGSGLTNLPSTGGSQVWTNDGTFTFLSGQLSPDLSGTLPGPNFFITTNGSFYVGTNVTQDWNPAYANEIYFPSVVTMGSSNEPINLNFQYAAYDNYTDQNYLASWIGQIEADPQGGFVDLVMSANGTNTSTISSMTFHIDGGTTTDFIDCFKYPTHVFKVSPTGSVISTGTYYGDGSGLTNLAVIETNVYQTFNVKNLTVQSNLFFFQSRPQVVAWSGPTNTLDFSLGQVFTYSTLVPVSITNIIGITNGYQNASLLWLTNTSSTNIAITLPTGWKTGRGDATTCTNGGVFQVWPAEAGGMRTIATKEYP